MIHSPHFEPFHCNADWKAIEREAELANSFLDNPVAETESHYDDRSILEMSLTKLKKLLKPNNGTKRLKSHP